MRAQTGDRRGNSRRPPHILKTAETYDNAHKKSNDFLWAYFFVNHIFTPVFSSLNDYFGEIFNANFSPKIPFKFVFIALYYKCKTKKALQKKFRQSRTITYGAIISRQEQ